MGTEKEMQKERPIGPFDSPTEIHDLKQKKRKSQQNRKQVT